MQVITKKLPKSTLQLNISVPADKVGEVYNEVLVALAGSSEMKGFRKGKAPKELVEKSLDPAKINGEVVNKLLEKYYIQALKEQKINPIANPRIEIQKFELEESFEFTAKIAIKPEIKLGDYKKALKTKATKKKEDAKKKKEEALKEGKDLKDVHNHLHTKEILDTIVEETEVEVPDLLVEDEVNRMSARLIDQIQSLNMEMEQYLKAQNKSSEQLTEEFSKVAEDNLKAEFAMAQAVKEAKIEVTDEEIEETAKASGDPKALENLKDPVHKWYIKSVLEKNRLLVSLMEELEGEKKASTNGGKEKDK